MKKKAEKYEWDVLFKTKKQSFKQILKGIEKLSKEQVKINMIIAKEMIKLLKREKPYENKNNKKQIPQRGTGEIQKR